MNNNWSTEESLVQKPNWWADNSLYFSRSSNKELKMTHMWIRCGTPKNPLFGIYWWTLRNPKNKNFEKMKTNCWRYHYFTHVYQKPQSYEVQILRNEVSQFFLLFWVSFCPLPQTKMEVGIWFSPPKLGWSPKYDKVTF